MSNKTNIPVPIYDYVNSVGMPYTGSTNGIPRVWADSKGGGPVKTSGPVTFGTVMPNGQFAHVGNYVSIDGFYQIVYHRH